VAVLRVAAFLAGATVVGATVGSAVRTLVVPRAVASALNRAVFAACQRLYNLRLRRASTYEERDRVMASYAPVSLLLLPVAWLALIFAGYLAMFWALDVGGLRRAALVSGSSLLTLGSAAVDDLPGSVLGFTEAALGLGLVAMLISYLPTIYGAFARREAAVAQLEARAGSPPSAVEMLERLHRIGWLPRLEDLWATWEEWFAEVEESHTSLGAMSFFRSPRPGRSWVTAAGTILDSASLALAAVDVPPTPQAAICIRSGYLALRHIADFFDMPHDPDPSPTDPISITREEFDQVFDRLAAAGVPMKDDRGQAWADFAGWRVNYDGVLLGLAGLTMAPYAPWSSDRSLPFRRPLLRRRRRLRRRPGGGRRGGGTWRRRTRPAPSRGGRPSPTRAPT
jgi:ABC-type multidrug transport system fused ATPase/permease subunit